MAMPDWHNIKYREYHDVPRAIVASRGNETFFFDCRFDETIDEYPDHYRVYLMPPLGNDQVSGSWESLELLAIKELERIPIRELPFDIAR